MKRRLWWMALAAVAWLAVPATAGAATNAVLYEVTENMYFYDSAGALIPADKVLSGQVAPAARVADATLQGWAALGNPLCPSQMLLISPTLKWCSVTAAGQDNISLATGKGTVTGTYAVVINLDNLVDAPEYVVQTGTFSGDMDLSIRPRGTISGTFTPTGSTVSVPFTGKFRLPYRLVNGQRHEPKRGYPAYYLADDGTTNMPLYSFETSLSYPLVRLELNF
jgi:hypothetical protein